MNAYLYKPDFYKVDHTVSFKTGQHVCDFPRKRMLLLFFSAVF